MSVKPENSFIRSVHKYLLDTYAMKNCNPYIGGIPDCWYSGQERDLWIEYKYIPVSKPRSILPDLSHLQLHWIEYRQKEGRDVWVVVGLKSGGVIIKNLHKMQVGVNLFAILSRKEIAKQISEHCNDRPE